MTRQLRTGRSAYNKTNEHLRECGYNLYRVMQVLNPDTALTRGMLVWMKSRDMGVWDKNARYERVIR